MLIDVGNQNVTVHVLLAHLPNFKSGDMLMCRVIMPKAMCITEISACVRQSHPNSSNACSLVHIHGVQEMR
jgi:hypothetical protein